MEMMSPYNIGKFSAVIALILIIGRSLAVGATFKIEAQEEALQPEITVGYVEVHPVVRIDDCNLNFQQGKKTIAAPQWFKDETWGGEWTCKERQVLSRLAYLESTYHKDVCNAKHKQYCGLFQIGNSARKECINNNRNTSDYACALYHFNVNPDRFEAYSRNKYLFN